jgi:hypothetical protein
MHLRRIRRFYADYYNRVKTHRSLNKDAPVSRPVQRTGEGAGGDDEEISEAKISWEGARFTESWSNVVHGFATVGNLAPNFTTRSRSAHLSIL